MLVVHLCDSRPVLGEKVIERRGIPSTVEGPVTVGKQDDHHSAGANDPVHLAYEPDGLSQVLEHVTADYEILALVWEGPKSVRVQVRHDVRFDEGCLRSELWEELPALVRLPAVHEADLGPGRGDLEGKMTGPH